MGGLVLSLFPGIGMLDLAFEEAGFCVVRGPDAIWGGDIRRFFPPSTVFDGVIGGPPCQSFSRLIHMVRANGYEPRFGNLIPEFERCVSEAKPQWFVMENVPAAPVPAVHGYEVHAQMLNNRQLGEEQNRVRRISFGTHDGLKLRIETVEVATSSSARHAILGDSPAVPVRLLKGGQVKSTASVTGGHGMGKNPKTTRYSIEDMCELQGLPRDFMRDSPFTDNGKRKAIGNGVPLAMGRAIAAAVIQAIEKQAA